MATRTITVDLRWATEGEHPNAAATVSNALLARGWVYAGSDGDDLKTFEREDDDVFEAEVHHAHQVVGRWLVKEPD